MNSSFTTPTDGMFIYQFLDCVDQVSDALGLSVPQIVAIEQLRLLPVGSFGRSRADFLDQRQLPPLTTGPRRKQLHDSVHVLAGYDSDAIGEAEVQAFLLGAKFHLANLVLGLGLLRMIHRRAPQRPPTVWLRLRQAYQRGQASSFNVDTWRPEEQWHLPLHQVQKLFKLE